MEENNMDQQIRTEEMTWYLGAHWNRLPDKQNSSFHPAQITQGQAL